MGAPDDFWDGPDPKDLPKPARWALMAFVVLWTSALGGAMIWALVRMVLN